MNYIELEHIPVDDGKDRARRILPSSLNIQSYQPVLDGRYRALAKKQYNPDADMEWLIKEILGIVPNLSDITTQRAIYYMLRGRYPDRKFRKNELGSDKFYGQLTGDGMKYTQIAAGVTMQSLGIWAAPRGYIAGNGRIYTSRRGGIPLTAQPTLQFDLCDTGSRLSSNARKVIHFEKDAGFASIVGGDMPKYIEAVFSTCFPANVDIQTKDKGLLPIKNINKGDIILSYDLNKKELTETEVINKFEHWVPLNQLVSLNFSPYIAGYPRLLCTKNHPFYVINKGWIKADNLQEGDIILDTKILIRNLRSKQAGRNVGKFNGELDSQGRHWTQQPENKIRLKPIYDAGRTASHKKYGKHLLNKAISIRRQQIIEGTSYQQSQEWQEIMRQRFLNNPLMDNPEWRRKALEHKTPSKIELLLDKLFKEANLPIEYVGNGSYFLNHTNPDFKVMGEKKLIEVSYSSFVNWYYGISYKEYVETRKTHYAKYDHKSLFLDMDKISPIEAVEKAKEFIVNGSPLYSKKYPTKGQGYLSKNKIEWKRENGVIYIKVYNIECSPYSWFLINRGLLVHNSQGQLSESANKFLSEAESWGLQVYSIHDADSYGLQMSLLYGLASKSNCYMPTEFYAQNVKSLGFFPSIAHILNLPPETINDEEAAKTFADLQEKASERPELRPEVDALISSMHKHEFQALNAIDEKAPHIYIVEGLRARDDEIKHVPDGDDLKQKAVSIAKDEIRDCIEDAISRATNRALEQARSGIEERIRESLTDQIEEFNQRAEDVITELTNTDSDNFREAVKQELVNNPAEYWDNSIGRVARRAFEIAFDISAEVDVVAEVRKVSADITANATPPEEPEEKLTKDDIVSAIEKRVIRQSPARNRVVLPIRDAFEQVFGEPDQKW